MGNRSRLFIQKKDKEIVLFESNNSLPFFWLTLLDKGEVVRALKYWRKLEKLEQYGEEEEIMESLEEYSTYIEISRKSLLQNITITKQLLLTHFSKAIALYGDFVDFIQSNLNEEDTLYIDMIQFSSFYDSVDIFEKVILQEIDAVHQKKARNITFLDNNDLIASGTGFVNLLFVDFSKCDTYQNALKNRKSTPVKNQVTYSSKSLGMNLILLILCPVFSWITYKMIMDNGFTTGEIVLGLSNLGFYAVSLFGITSQYNAFRRNMKRNSKK